MVDVISGHLPKEHSLFHAHVPLSATEVLLSQDRVCVEQFASYHKTDYQLWRVLGVIWKLIYSGPRNRSALWLSITVCYTDTFTYLLTNGQTDIQPQTRCGKDTKNGADS